MLDVNTVNKYPTHFSRAVELIIKARIQFGIPSENWPHPIADRFGCPNEWYYAEIWADGMDWQPSYWVIEEKKLASPQVQPFITFSKNEDRYKFNDYDFSELIKASLWHRRDLFWVKQNDLGYFTDAIWPFITVVNSDKTAAIRSNLSRVYFEHASQPNVRFLMNLDFIPSEYLEVRKSDRKGILEPIQASSGEPGDVGY